MHMDEKIEARNGNDSLCCGLSVRLKRYIFKIIVAKGGIIFHI